MTTEFKEEPPFVTSVIQELRNMGHNISESASKRQPMEILVELVSTGIVVSQKAWNSLETFEAAAVAKSHAVAADEKYKVTEKVWQLDEKLRIKEKVTNATGLVSSYGYSALDSGFGKKLSNLFFFVKDESIKVADEKVKRQSEE